MVSSYYTSHHHTVAHDISDSSILNVVPRHELYLYKIKIIQQLHIQDTVTRKWFCWQFLDILNDNQDFIDILCFQMKFIFIFQATLTSNVFT
jgi:hypothetical protein